MPSNCPEFTRIHSNCSRLTRTHPNCTRTCSAISASGVYTRSCIRKSLPDDAVVSRGEPRLETNETWRDREGLETELILVLARYLYGTCTAVKRYPLGSHKVGLQMCRRSGSSFGSKWTLGVGDHGILETWDLDIDVSISMQFRKAGSGLLRR